MKHTMNTGLSMGITVILMGTVMLFTGCEGGDDPGASSLDSYFADHPFLSDPRGNTENPISISPDTAFVDTVNQQIVFRAAGGTGPYQWDVAIPGNGRIDASRNWRVGVYTADKLADNSVIVYDRNGYAAVADVSIAQNADEPLSVSASPETLTSDGDKSALAATGGQPPYTWSVHDVALGNIDSTSGDSVIYTRYNPGDNGVNVVDQHGNNANVVIEQP